MHPGGEDRGVLSTSGPRAAGSDIVTLLGQAESARRTGVPWQVEVKLEAPGERVGQSGRLLSNSTVSTVLLPCVRVESRLPSCWGRCGAALSEVLSV